jgi:3-oxoacyl-ACP reductase-like protein
MELVAAMSCSVAVNDEVEGNAMKTCAAPVAVEEVKEAEVALAPGSAGQLKLYDTPPKTAAMLMAIVADKLGKPLNELRFISIKEVK